MENEPIIVLGGGGHASVLIATLLLQGRAVLGFVDSAAPMKSIYRVKCLGDDDEIWRHRPVEVRLVNGLGSIGSNIARSQLFHRFKDKGYRFASVVHPTAIVAHDVRLSEGVQIMAAAVLQPGSQVGANCIVNTGAVIDHHCKIGAHVHVGPGATLSGQVHLAVGVHIGTGASVIQSLRIGSWSVVGAGAAVVRNVPARVTVVGLPARVLKTKMPGSTKLGLSKAGG
ncbi:MAG: acetyltransferase [Ktedonobacteraceae bacterium]|nr:acetyltransferase [Ktedonobacteraceae bacterium]